MLADPRAQALVSNFAGQWLHIRNLRSTTPDKNDFPDFDDNLRKAFEHELELFVGSIFSEDRSVLDLMTADHTFLNERLAKHYGIPNVYGPHFRRVTLDRERADGAAWQGGDPAGDLARRPHVAGVARQVDPRQSRRHAATPASTRGPGVPEETPGSPKSVRARMEQHRASPACASCHRVMDPLGLALENFDAVGAWRTQEAGSTIDASGELEDGTRIDGAVALRTALLKRPDQFVGTMTEKLLIYALGRGLDHHDMPAVRESAVRPLATAIVSRLWFAVS